MQCASGQSRDPKRNPGRVYISIPIVRVGIVHKDVLLREHQTLSRIQKRLPEIYLQNRVRQRRNNAHVTQIIPRPRNRHRHIRCIRLNQNRPMAYLSERHRLQLQSTQHLLKIVTRVALSVPTKESLQLSASHQTAILSLATPCEEPTERCSCTTPALGVKIPLFPPRSTTNIRSVSSAASHASSVSSCGVSTTSSLIRDFLSGTANVSSPTTDTETLVRVGVAWTVATGRSR